MLQEQRTRRDDFDSNSIDLADHYRGLGPSEIDAEESREQSERGRQQAMHQRRSAETQRKQAQARQVDALRESAGRLRTRCISRAAPSCVKAWNFRGSISSIPRIVVAIGPDRPEMAHSDGATSHHVFARWSESCGVVHQRFRRIDRCNTGRHHLLRGHQDQVIVRPSIRRVTDSRLRA